MLFALVVWTAAEIGLTLVGITAFVVVMMLCDSPDAGDNDL